MSHHHIPSTSPVQCSNVHDAPTMLPLCSHEARSAVCVSAPRCKINTSKEGKPPRLGLGRNTVGCLSHVKHDTAGVWPAPCVEESNLPRGQCPLLRGYTYRMAVGCAEGQHYSTILLSISFIPLCLYSLCQLWQLTSSNNFKHCTRYLIFLQRRWPHIGYPKLRCPL